MILLFCVGIDKFFWIFVDWERVGIFCGDFEGVLYSCGGCMWDRDFWGFVYWWIK